MLHIDDADGGDDGTGSGLTIVRRIAEPHGRQIALTEAADGGARFEITGIETAPDHGR